MNTDPDLTPQLESSLSFARELNALREQNRVLREALGNSAHRVRWLQQFANVDREPIDAELATWDALVTKVPA